MQTQPQPRIQFLEDWLRSSTPITTTTATSGSRPLPPASARAVLQAWAELRDPSLPHSQPDRLFFSLQTLSDSRSSLHVAEPQAKLLLSLLPSSPPLYRPHLFLLLYTWLRKSPRPSPPLLDSALSVISPLLSSFPAHGVLLLGALSAAQTLSDSSRELCLDLLCRILEDERASIWSSENLVPEVLAGIGYALSRSPDLYFTRIFTYLLGIWNKEGGPCPSLLHGLMILRLVEWLALSFVNSRALNRIEFLCGELSVDNCVSRNYARFGVVMASAGLLRAIHPSSSSSKLRINPQLRNSLEGTICFVAKYVISCVEGNYSLGVTLESHLLLQCISLGLVRCGGLNSFNGSVFLCLFLALSNEIFPLHAFFRRAIENPNGNSATVGLDKVKEHLDSVLFKEAGAVTGIFCRQYDLAEEGNKGVVENYIWDYCQELYLNLRTSALVHRGKSDELLGDLEKIAEAAFLMVVVFAAEVTKHRLNPKTSNEIHPEVSAKILVAFSCLEYLRRVRLPEYTDVVRRAVLTIQENAVACASFVESMPPYAELANQKGRRYVWLEDEVQTARMLFYLRVIPTCISLIPASVFRKLVASTMFLYMQHPNGKVARASHSVFVAFMSSGKDSDQDDRLALKEQLVFYYIQRALEAYPGVTPLEGLASGVTALVRHLPAGNPAIFYCIHSLVGKATHLCRTAMSQDTTNLRTWDGNLEPSKKVVDLLLCLISLVDIQVFPYLLKQLAEFVVQLPEDGQNVLLDEMYSTVAESDDVTRKPVLVSWLQSLSYLCSQRNNKSFSKGGNAEKDILNLSSSDDHSLNSRL